MHLKACPVCKCDISLQAPSCPHCGQVFQTAPRPAPDDRFNRAVKFAIVAVAVLLVVEAVLILLVFRRIHS